VKALNTQPISTAVRWRSSLMDDAADAMHTRSRKVTTERKNANRSRVNRALVMMGEYKRLSSI
jgi:hypothetical protein